MTKPSTITIAAKCAPHESILGIIAESGINAVELYTDASFLSNIDEIVKICKRYPLRYALHAPPKGYEPGLVAALAEQINAEVVVFHNIYWEDEWDYIVKRFAGLPAKLCMENVYSAIEPVKYMRRFGISRCLDLEHLLMEVNGIFEGPFFSLMKDSSHIHMTGYIFGSNKWHTPIHYTPDQSIYFLNMLKKAGYSGLVVSEAQESYQTKEEFIALNAFFKRWERGDT